MANANYAPVTSTTAYSGLAYIGELLIGSKAWTSQYDEITPFLTKVIKNGRGNVQYAPDGSLKMIAPVWGGSMVAGDVVGVARNSETTALGYATASNGTQLEVPLALFMNKGIQFTATELAYAKDQGKLGRGNVMEGRYNEVHHFFRKKVATALYAGATASTSTIMALNYAVATGNTVHNIDQSTYTWWQGNVDTTGGAFDLEKFDRHLSVLADEKDANPDMCILAAPSGGVDIYSKVKRLLGDDVYVMTKQDQGGTLSKGFKGIEYCGVEFVRDHYATAGEVLILDTSTWVWGGDRAPKFFRNLSPLDNMPAFETIFEWRCALACKSPRRNYRWTGITG